MATVPILLYHSIDDSHAGPYARWAISPGQFDEHLAVLREDNYTPLTACQFTACVRGTTVMPQRPVLVTFDDSLVDLYENAIPLLEKYAIPATFFTVTNKPGAKAHWLKHAGEGDRRTMNVPELQHLLKLGHEIGGHSRSHCELDIAGPARQRSEIRDGKAELEQWLGHKISTFAYPYGYWNHNARSIAAQAGYVAAFQVNNRLYSVGGDLFTIPRLIVEAGMSGDQLRQFIGNAMPPVKSFVRRTMVLGWRSVRFARYMVTALQSQS